MKKKIVPILVVLVLAFIGVGGYFLNREFHTSPSLETPPGESSTPEVTPTTPVAETTSPVSSVEVSHEVKPAEPQKNRTLPRA